MSLGGDDGHKPHLSPFHATNPRSIAVPAHQALSLAASANHFVCVPSKMIWSGSEVTYPKVEDPAIRAWCRPRWSLQTTTIRQGSDLEVCCTRTLERVVNKYYCCANLFQSSQITDLYVLVYKLKWKVWARCNWSFFFPVTEKGTRLFVHPKCHAGNHGIWMAKVHVGWGLW